MAESEELSAGALLAQQFNEEFESCIRTLQANPTDAVANNKLANILLVYLKKKSGIFAYRYPDPNDLEDIVQKTAVSLLSFFKKTDFQRVENPSSYVLGSMRHQCTGHRRHQHPVLTGLGDEKDDRMPNATILDMGRPTHSLRGVGVEMIDDNVPQVEDFYTDNELTLLKKSIATLAEKDADNQLLLNSTYLCNPRKSSQQLANEMGCPPTTARSRLHTAKRRLFGVIPDVANTANIPEEIAESLIAKLLLLNAKLYRLGGVEL